MQFFFSIEEGWNLRNQDGKGRFEPRMAKSLRFKVLTLIAKSMSQIIYIKKFANTVIISFVYKDLEQ